MNMPPTELLERARANADRIGEAISEVLGTNANIQITDVAIADDLSGQLASCFAVSAAGTTLFLNPGIIDAIPADESDGSDDIELLSTFARRAWPVVSGSIGDQSGGPSSFDVRGPGKADLGAILGSSVISAILSVADVPVEVYVHLSGSNSDEAAATEASRGTPTSLQLDELQAGGTTADHAFGLGLLGDVEVNVTVELGRRRIPLNELLKLTRGSIIELEKFVGEPLEVYVNNRLIADGEAVVIDDHFGIRITNIIPSIQRNS